MVALGQKWLYSGKSCCIRTKVVVFMQKWLYLGKVVIFGKKWLYIGKVVVYGRTWLYPGNVVVFGKLVVVVQNWWYYCKSGCTRANIVLFG